MAEPVGRPKAIKTPARMLELAKEYFKYVDDNPILKHDFVGKEAEEVYRKLQRPYTWSGFEVFLFNRNILSDLTDYRENKEGRYAQFVPILNVIGQIIYSQKFEGASAGIFNATIIARDINLREQAENTNTNTSRVEIVVNSPEAKKEIDKLLNS